MQNKATSIALITVSLFSVLLVVARILYSDRMLYSFLVWNLMLAWLPLGFASLAYRFRRRSLLTAVMLFFWILFLPNAPYLMTDLLHLKHIPPVPEWYDLILLLDYALLGLLLGLASLKIMHTLIDARYGRWVGWIFVMCALAMSGFGVYIGRFLRWNSWDLFVQPLELLGDLSKNLAEPRALVLSSLLAVVLFFTYYVYASSAGVPGEVQEH